MHADVLVGGASASLYRQREHTCALFQNWYVVASRRPTDGLIERVPCAAFEYFFCRCSSYDVMPAASCSVTFCSQASAKLPLRDKEIERDLEVDR